MAINNHGDIEIAAAVDTATARTAPGENGPGHTGRAALTGSGGSTSTSRQAMREVFTRIYRNNTWGGEHSVSGPGSELTQTERIIHELPGIFRTFGIRSVLDIPCGDFHWMQWVDLAGIDYRGADIVPEIIERNRAVSARPNVRFEVTDLIHDQLPGVDLILCRDCLVHFDINAVLDSLWNIAASGSRYLLTTTFTGNRVNRGISTGQWLPLSLESPPFRFPPPLQVVHEGCGEKGGAYADKALALWRIEDFRGALNDIDSHAIANDSHS